MSSLDTVLLDYVSAVKSNWAEWHVEHRKGWNEYETCRLCKQKILKGQDFSILMENEKRGCHWHESCLESMVKETPDLKGKLRL